MPDEQALAKPSLVNCGACGRQLSVAATACPHCGHPQTPQHALEIMRRYSRWERNVTCIECGYRGPMGVTRTKVRWFVSWPILILLCATGVGVVFAYILWLWRFRYTDVFIFCPGCEKELGPLR